MTKTHRLALVCAKFLEISHWIAAAAWLCILSVTIVMGQQAFSYDTILGRLFNTGVSEGSYTYTYRSINVYGLSVRDTEEYGKSFVPVGTNFDMRREILSYHIDAIIVYCIGGLLLMSLMALVFHNAYGILKISARDRSPFQKSVVKKLRCIGGFLIGMSAVCIAASFIAGTMTGSMHLCLGLEHTAFGVLILGLAEYFCHGIELEKETEGLI